MSAGSLKARRQDLGLSQKALAAAAGINLRQLQKMEAGEISLQNITLKNALALADALGVDVRDLISE